MRGRSGCRAGAVVVAAGVAAAWSGAVSAGEVFDGFVEISVLAAPMTARDWNGNVLWTRDAVFAPMRSSVLSEFGGVPNNAKFIHRFSNFGPFVGSIPGFGDITWNLSLVTGTGRDAGPGNRWTDIKFQGRFATGAGTYLPTNSAETSFRNNAFMYNVATESFFITVNNPTLRYFNSNGQGSPRTLEFGGRTLLQFRVIPAPGAGGVALAACVLAGARRRRDG